jgi:uncharacterized protein YndB with AHSA1/START domain
MGTEIARWVDLKRRLEAGPERAYRALADPEDLARWFPIRVEGGLAVGGRTTLVWPDRRVSLEVLEAVPNHRFVFRWPWRGDDHLVTTASVTIEPVGYGSRFMLRDGPFQIDEPGGLDTWVEAVERWSEAVTMLRAYLDFSVDVRVQP